MGLVSVKVDAAGRMVVPKDLREQLGIPQGGELKLSVVDGELRGLTRLAALRLLQREVAEHSAATGQGSAVEELFAMRREEARRLAEEADKATGG